MKSAPGSRCVTSTSVSCRVQIVPAMLLPALAVIAAAYGSNWVPHRGRGFVRFAKD